MQLVSENAKCCEKKLKQDKDIESREEVLLF